VAYGYVLDFIDIGVGSLRFWTFNIADAGITLGIVILLIENLWHSRSTVRT
jgi:signal peptidase II